MSKYDMDHTYSVLAGDGHPNGDVNARWAHFDSIISNFLSEQHIPGAAVAISSEEKIIYKQGYGVAGCSRRVQPDSVFRIASISKPITAAVVMQVCAKANVSLDKPVFGKQGILKTYRVQDKRMKKISIRHLLQHSGGWDRDKVGDIAFVRPQCVIQHHPDSEAYNHALLAYALRRKLQFPPGAWHAYSNLGYLALGQVVEELTGKSYQRVLKDFLQSLAIHGITVGLRKRSEWNESEVEYFNNKDPAVVESLYPGEGLVLPQYGGMAMPSSASYGGLIADSSSLLQFIYCMETAVRIASRETQKELSQPSSRHHQHSKGKELHALPPTSQYCTDSEVFDSSISQDLLLDTFIKGNERSAREEADSLTNTGETKTSVKEDSPQACPQKGREFHSDIHQVAAVDGKLRAMPLMAAAQVKETLERPGYEDTSAGDWYGLGWDVQDNGVSWGHTGGMEGTCGTLYHHGQSGLSWAFLLNAWAQDCDLNGVIKSGLMMTSMSREGEDSNRSLLPGIENMTWDSGCSCARMTRADNAKDSHGGSVRVITKNRQQIVLLNAREVDAFSAVNELKSKGYFVTWISCMTQQLHSAAKSVSACDKDTGERQNQHCVYMRSSFETCLCQRYCVIFTKSSLCYKDYILLFDKSIDEFNTALCQFREKGYCITFLDSCCRNSSLKFCAVICLDNQNECLSNKSCDSSIYSAPTISKTSHKHAAFCKKSFSSSTTFSTSGHWMYGEGTEVCLAQRATDYVRVAKTLAESHHILGQTVSEVEEELWVSVVLRPRARPQKQQTEQEEADAPDLSGIPTQHRKTKRRNLKFDRTNHISPQDSSIPAKKTSRNFTRSESSQRALPSHQSASTLKFQNSSQQSQFESPTSLAASNSSKKNANVPRTKRPLDSKDTVYWVQISPESFLTELHRQMQRGRGLLYAKFYTAAQKPYVSAIWAKSSPVVSNDYVVMPSTTSDCSETVCGIESEPAATSRYHRTAMSKYGLLPELAEAASRDLILQSLSEYTEEDGSVYYAAIWFA